MQTRRDDSIYCDIKTTSRGIQMEASLLHLYLRRTAHQLVLDVFCKVCQTFVGVYLRRIGGNRYARWKPGLLAFLDHISI